MAQRGLEGCQNWTEIQNRSIPDQLEQPKCGKQDGRAQGCRRPGGHRQVSLNG